jgi:hypothetical protein
MGSVEWQLALAALGWSEAFTRVYMRDWSARSVTLHFDHPPAAPPFLAPRLGLRTDGCCLQIAPTRVLRELVSSRLVHARPLPSGRFAREHLRITDRGRDTLAELNVDITLALLTL